jgi:hypothetical protein
VSRIKKKEINSFKLSRHIFLLTVNNISAYVSMLKSRKVAGSIPDDGIGIFHSHNPFSRTVALGIDSVDRNEYHKYFLGGKGGRCVQLITLPPLCTE